MTNQTALRLCTIAAAKAYDLTPEELMKETCEQKYVMPRQLAMTLAREEFELSWREISQYFSKKARKTALASVQRIRELVQARDYQTMKHLDLALQELDKLIEVEEGVAL